MEHLVERGWSSRWSADGAHGWSLGGASGGALDERAPKTGWSNPPPPPPEEKSGYISAEMSTYFQSFISHSRLKGVQ